MTLLIKTLAAVAAGTMLATSAFAQSAREFRGASPFETIENEPAAKLIVDPPLPGPLAQGLFLAQYRVENVRLLQVFGPGALSVSPRIGHLHINVNDLPWMWADASDNNTVDIAGFPPGEHKVKIDLVNANHEVFNGQSVTVTFTVPATAREGARAQIAQHRSRQIRDAASLPAPTKTQKPARFGEGVPRAPKCKWSQRLNVAHIPRSRVGQVRQLSVAQLPCIHRRQTGKS